MRVKEVPQPSPTLMKMEDIGEEQHDQPRGGGDKMEAKSGEGKMI